MKWIGGGQIGGMVWCWVFWFSVCCEITPSGGFLPFPAKHLLIATSCTSLWRAFTWGKVGKWVRSGSNHPAHVSLFVRVSVRLVLGLRPMNNREQSLGSCHLLCAGLVRWACWGVVEWDIVRFEGRVWVEWIGAGNIRGMVWCWVFCLY
jgi:hypothetical protein